MEEEIILIQREEPGVYTNDPDGAYVHHGKDGCAGQVQVVIKGPMPFRPGDYEKPVSDLCGKPMKLTGASFLPYAPDCNPEQRYAIRRAGFISLKFRERHDG